MVPRSKWPRTPRAKVGKQTHGLSDPQSESRSLQGGQHFPRTVSAEPEGPPDADAPVVSTGVTTAWERDFWPFSSGC